MSTVRIVAMMGLVLVMFAAILFGSAGRLDLPFFWAYLGVVVASIVAGSLVMDRGLIQERMKPGPGGVDRRLRVLAMPFLVAHVVVAGLDVRYQFSDTIPDWLRIAGLVAFAAMMALVLSALKVNPFFSPVVRIQEERGHYLVTTGPYRFIRHPGYANAILAFPCGGLTLGSWWAIAPLIVPAGLIFRRIIVEDRYLKEHLDGYREYAERVRYRIIPGIW